MKTHAFHHPSLSLLAKVLSSMFCLAAPLSADQFGLFTYRDNGTTITITGYPEDATGPVEIPATIAGKPVTSIGWNAFSFCSGLTSVTIPSSVTSIGEGAFSLCSGLTSVTIPSSVTSIGEGAFSLCSGLTSVTIPDSVTSIGDEAFSHCTGLTSVTIPDSVTSIGGGAFHGCNGLTSVTFASPSSVTSIGDTAFLYCSGLTSVTIPSSVTSIGGGAFVECSGLTSITVEAANPNYSSLGGVLFDKLQTLLIQCPGGFSGSFVIPDSVTDIGANAFYDCNKLTSVTIPSSVTRIRYQVFYGCAGLTSVTIPSSVTSIGDWAFYLCSELTSAVFAGDAPSLVGDVFGYVAGGFTVYFFDGAAGFSTPTWEGYAAVNLGDPDGDPDNDGLTTYQEVVVHGTNPNLADTDGDGLNDGQERDAGANPFLADTDGDGLSDGAEVNLTQTSPILADSDGNGTADGAEDPDADGLDNLAEVNVHGTDPRAADTDGDGLDDGVELAYAGSFFDLVEGSFTWPQAVEDAAARKGRVAVFPDQADFTRTAHRARAKTAAHLWIGLSDAAAEGTWVWGDGSPLTYARWFGGQPDGAEAENNVVIVENATSWADAQAEFAAGGYLFERVGLDPLNADTDGDGLSDGEEINTVGSSPADPDTDGDGLADGDEVNTHGSSPTNIDTDGDGLGDYVEVTVHGSNPALADSDGDGFDDKFEVETGFDPASDTSTPEAWSQMLIAVEFRFNAAAGVTYKIESSTDMTNWELVEGGIVGEGSRVTRFYSIENMPKRYFRARRE